MKTERQLGKVALSRFTVVTFLNTPMVFTHFISLISFAEIFTSAAAIRATYGHAAWMESGDEAFRAKRLIVTGIVWKSSSWLNAS